MFSNVKSTYQASLKTRNKKADRIKNLMKEYKLLFGDLIETGRQKKMRLKLESKGKIAPQESSKEDTELFWVLQTSQKYLKRITKSPTPQNELYNGSQIVETEKNIFLAKVDETISKKERDKAADPRCDLSRATEDINEITSASGLLKAYLHENTSKESSNSTPLSKLDRSNMENRKNNFNFKRLPDIVIKNLPSFPIMRRNKQESIAQSTEVLSISGSDDPATIKFPSVTRILSQTMSPESKLALEAWKKRMIEKLGQDGFQMHQKGMFDKLLCSLMTRKIS